jgi:hypothetical protein
MGVPYIPPDKIAFYLLNTNHPTGQGKAKFFMSRGFRINDPGQLERALGRHPETAREIARVVTPDGQTKRVFECELDVPTGVPPCIRSVWIEESQGGRLRFVTAYPFA